MRRAEWNSGAAGHPSVSTIPLDGRHEAFMKLSLMDPVIRACGSDGSSGTTQLCGDWDCYWQTFTPESFVSCFRPLCCSTFPCLIPGPEATLTRIKPNGRVKVLVMLLTLRDKVMAELRAAENPFPYFRVRHQ